MDDGASSITLEEKTEDLTDLTPLMSKEEQQMYTLDKIEKLLNEMEVIGNSSDETSDTDDWMDNKQVA